MNFLGVNTTTPWAQLHVQATAAPAAFFDVVSNSLGALPVVYRAARGTPSALGAVQTDDILGGLAVRAYNGSAWTGGMGQVMFKAAENWTPAANGTYLQFTTTPIGQTSYVERVRITPSGQVRIGPSADPDGRAVKLLVDDSYYNAGNSTPAKIVARANFHAISGESMSGSGISGSSDDGIGVSAGTTSGWGLVASHYLGTLPGGHLAGPDCGVFGSSDFKSLNCGGAHSYGYLGNANYGAYAYHQDGVALRADSDTERAIWGISASGFGVEGNTSGADRAALIGRATTRPVTVCRR